MMTLGTAKNADRDVHTRAEREKVRARYEFLDRLNKK